MHAGLVQTTLLGVSGAIVINTKISLSDVEAVQRLYSFLLNEVKQAAYTPREIALLGNTLLYYGRYLNPNLRNYFIQTVVPHIASAISYFCVRDRPNLTICDLGCGLGMQSIILASLGAKIVAVDKREDSIVLCKKRKTYYENALQCDLDIDFHHCDFSTINAKAWDCTFDCLFSMSAFSYITPLDRTVKRISSLLKEDAKVFLYEVNESHLLRFLKRGRKGNIETPTPWSTISAFEGERFRKNFLYGGCSLPGRFWSVPALNRLLLHPLNNLLRKSLYLSFNYVLGMERGRV